MKNKPVPRQYPREVWVISPAYIVKQETVVKRSYAYSNIDYGDETVGRKRYRPEAMHKSRADAIEYGRKRIEERREYLAKQAALLDVRSAKLDKAEAK